MSTLVWDPFPTVFCQFFALSEAELLRQKDRSAWLDFEKGRITEATLGQRYFLDRRPVDVRALRHQVSHAYAWLPGIEALLGELRAAGVEMHACSNYPLWYEEIERALGLGRFMPWTFVSCRMDCRKPEAEFFTRVVEALGRPPGELLFIDDKEVNCEAAGAAGIPSVRFESAEQLRRALPLS